MDISIILVSYNTIEHTRKCIESIFSQTSGVNFDIYVVDNASNDGSQEMIKNEFPEIKLIENKKNVGFGTANNQAIKQSNSKYVFLLNPDTILLNNAVKIFFDYMEKLENNNVGCCGGNLYNSDMSPQISSGNFPTIKHIIFEFGLNKIFKSYFLKNISDGICNYDEDIKEVDIIIGADMFIRKSSLDKSGLFDEDFFLYYEEAELCYRIKKNDYKLMLIPESKIMHLYSQSSKNMDMEKRLKTQVTGKYLFYKKSYGLFKAKLSCFLYIIKFLLISILTRKKEHFIRLKVNLNLLFINLI